MSGEKCDKARSLLKKALWVQESETAEIPFLGITIILPTNERRVKLQSISQFSFTRDKG